MAGSVVSNLSEPDPTENLITRSSQEGQDSVIGSRARSPWTRMSCGTLSPLDSEEAEKKIAVSRMIIEVEQRESCREASMSYCTFDARIKAE
ncbi:hypothetical protein SAY87_010007 [Trapa incisa]|uniref:Uncharacterized protein n=1 Tax=Trapa incisa TaxID=236973 RepID=A0AAN7JHT1_9MYRT|nr:hypothetical protein SAY87_010007 [Trapa incisa]